MGIYLGKIKPRQDTGTTTFSAGLFTRAATWIQPKFPCKENMDTEDVILRYKGKQLSHEINEIRPVAATLVYLCTIILSDISKTEKETYHTISVIGAISKLLHMN